MIDSDFPLVSVITPTYNRAGLLPETIESVLAQDCPNFEYIILDDGSTDNTQEILDQYQDTRIFRVRHDNMGVIRTVNKGFDLAKGDFITVVNSDDPVLPGLISESVKFLQDHPEVIGSYPDWEMIDENSRSIQTIITEQYSFVYALRHGQCLQGPGTMFRRSIFDNEKPYDLNFPVIFDYELYMRVGTHELFMRLPQILATYRQHKGTITKSQKGTNVTKERIEMLDKLFAHPKMPEEGKRVKRQAYGSAHYITGVLSVDDKRKKAAYHFLRSIIICPIGCRPNNYPRRCGFMLYIMISALLPRVIRRPLGKIIMKLEDK